MKTSSCKAKGRNLQKLIHDLIYEHFPHLEEGDVRSTSMGASGEDLLLSPAARKALPVSIEAKNQEKVNVWASYEQAKGNAGKYEPLLVIKKNHKKPLAVVDLNYFLSLFSGKKQ